MQTYTRLDIGFESGEGAWLTATNGEKYLDALSGISVCNLGHAHPAIHAAITAQSKKLLHTSNLYQIPLQEQLAARLTQLSGMRSVFFANSGAEANEAAIKVCRKWAAEQHIAAPVIVTMQGSFHGRTMATLTATGNDKVKQGFQPLLSGFQHVPYDDIPALEKLLASDTDIVAVMLEPVQGEGGVVIPAAGYLASIRQLCDQYNCLLVVDEIQTGLCRTGKWFAYQHDNILPDVVTLAKSLGNGVPIGACMVHEKLNHVLQPGNHGSTFGGNPLASAAAIAVIDTLQAEGFANRVQQLGEYMLNGFIHRIGSHKQVQQVRGKGMMLGIELTQACAQLVQAAIQKHLLINVTAGNVIRLLPPFIISDAMADSIVDGVSELIENVKGS